MARKTHLAALVASIAAAASFATTASAQGRTLLINTNPAGLSVYGGLHVGGAAWAGVTSLIGQAFGSNITTAATLLGADLGRFDALWIDQRWHAGPTVAELQRLRAYIQSGRRVVIIGENATWGPWNAAILGILGGSEGPAPASLFTSGGPSLGCVTGGTNTVLANELTVGVSRIAMACGGYAVGGTALFDYNVATLWGSKQNVLTILDANVLDDPFGSALDGKQFRQNVVDWVSEAPSFGVAAVTTPEPSTIALVAGGLLVLGASYRRRRSA